MHRLSLFAAGLMVGTSAVAQEAEVQGPATAPDLEAEAAGNEIIVTAQKREQRLIDVPISIVAKTGVELQNAGIDDFNDVAARVPNLIINETPANKQITIRGIGTTGNSFSFEQSVALFVDGIYGGRNRQYNQPFLDIERLEVLRGPQGALFGRNTAAGAISVTTARPKQEYSAEIFGEYEFRTESVNTTAIVNGALSDRLAVRIATRFADQNGFLETPRSTGLSRRRRISSGASRCFTMPLIRSRSSQSSNTRTWTSSERRLNSRQEARCRITPRTPTTRFCPNRTTPNRSTASSSSISESAITR
jgi:iron complex outermembrane receptor protein